jgi:hypothetical protein
VRSSVSSDFLLSRGFYRSGILLPWTRCARLQFVEDRITDTLSVAPQMRIPEPQRFNAARLQKRCALGIVIPRVRKAMLAAVQFNVQGRFLAEEIQIIDAHGVLTAEFVAAEAAVRQPAPDQLLRPSFLFAELTGAFNVGHEESLANGLEMGKLVVGFALILTFSPWEKEQPSRAAGFVQERSAIPATRFIKRTVDVSPSPRRRGTG